MDFLLYSVEIIQLALQASSSDRSPKYPIHLFSEISLDCSQDVCGNKMINSSPLYHPNKFVERIVFWHSAAAALVIQSPTK